MPLLIPAGPHPGDELVILSAGLTPAWQQILLFDTFTPGAVNRARQVHWCASGKVLNTARALHHLGANARTLTVIGGTTGDAIRWDIAEMSIAARWIEGPTPTRICTTLLDAARRTATELVPNAAQLGAAELHDFRTAYAEEAATAGVVVLIGSLPLGTPADYYQQLLSLTPGRAILDARGAELLEALPARPFLVKPNRAELQQTLQRELHSDAQLFDAMRVLNERGAEWVVVTDGANPVHARSRDQLVRLRPPAREVVNPIGCGDCMAAGIACALARGLEAVPAIRHGLATAANKLGQMLPGFVEREQVERLVQDVEVTSL